MVGSTRTFVTDRQTDRQTDRHTDRRSWFYRTALRRSKKFKIQNDLKETSNSFCGPATSKYYPTMMKLTCSYHTQFLSFPSSVIWILVNVLRFLSFSSSVARMSDNPCLAISQFLSFPSSVARNSYINYFPSLHCMDIDFPFFLMKL